MGFAFTKDGNWFAKFGSGEFPTLVPDLTLSEEKSSGLTFWTESSILAYEDEFNEGFPMDNYPPNMYYGNVVNHSNFSIAYLVEYHRRYNLPAPRFTTIDLAEHPITENIVPATILPLIFKIIPLQTKSNKHFLAIWVLK